MIELRIRAADATQLDDLLPDGWTTEATVEVNADGLLVTVNLPGAKPTREVVINPPKLAPGVVIRFDDPARRDSERRPYDIEPNVPSDEPEPGPLVGEDDDPDDDTHDTEPAPVAATWQTADDLDRAIIDVLKVGASTAHDIAYVLDDDEDLIRARLRSLKDRNRVESAGVKGWKLRRRDFDHMAARARAAEAL